MEKRIDRCVPSSMLKKNITSGTGRGPAPPHNHNTYISNNEYSNRLSISGVHCRLVTAPDKECSHRQANSASSPPGRAPPPLYVAITTGASE